MMKDEPLHSHLSVIHPSSFIIHTFPMTHDDKLKHYIIPNYGRYDVWPVRGEARVCLGSRWEEVSRLRWRRGRVPAWALSSAGGEGAHEQASTLIHVSNWYCIDKQAELAAVSRRECVQIPASASSATAARRRTKVCSSSHGKYGQQTGGRYEIITFTGSFHGRTFRRDDRHRAKEDPRRLRPTAASVSSMCRSMTSRHSRSRDQRQNRRHPRRADSGRERCECCDAGVPAHRAAFVPREGRLAAALDEVQVGFGRAGEMAGWRSIIPGDEIQPDGISWAKAIGSGFPARLVLGQCRAPMGI
jgi:acetylornithine/N-succinyldiaminopimelate aminotransferase